MCLKSIKFSDCLNIVNVVSMQKGNYCMQATTDCCMHCNQFNLHSPLSDCFVQIQPVMFDIVALKYHTQSEKTRSYYIYIEANMFTKT